MIDPHKKAKQLLQDFASDLHGNAIESNAINKYRCALRCVDEIVLAIENMGHGETWSLENMDKKMEYWAKVKFHIEKLHDNGF